MPNLKNAGRIAMYSASGIFARASDNLASKTGRSQTDCETEGERDGKTLGMMTSTPIQSYRQQKDRRGQLKPVARLDYAKPASGGSPSEIAAMPSGNVLASKIVTQITSREFVPDYV